jgi:hypothetical protein
MMKFLGVLFLVFVLTGFCHAQSWQDVSDSAFTNAQIVWQVPSNTLPKTLWVYRRQLPHVFPASVISNAIVLGSLENHVIPQPSTNDFYILPEVPPNWPAPIPTLFGMLPKDAYLYFSGSAFAQVLTNDIPDDETITTLARGYAPQLGIASVELKHGKFRMHMGDDENGTNIFGRSIFFPRELDGISFFSADDSGDSAEGFFIEFGGHGKVQAFSVRWSEMEHYKDERIASREEITRCIQTHKAIVLPNFKADDFAWLKSLANTKKLTIVRITLYYGEGIFGGIPAKDTPCEYATPFAELQAVADMGEKHIPVRILSPMLSVEVAQLLKLRTQN